MAARKNGFRSPEERAMPKAIIGRKLGMTQIFTPTGDCVAVTVVKVGPCTVVRKKSVDGKDGYNALVLGFEDVRSAQVDGETVYKMNRPELGVFKAAGVEPCKSLHEVRVSAADLDKYEVGQKVNADTFFPGEVIDVIGTSKGSGFTGVMKRHNFAGAKRSHGAHEYKRHGGSIGTTSTPGRVMKNRKMAGQDGNARVTVQNLKVYSIDADQNLILVKGSIPGANGSVVCVQDAVKARH
ncbi:MAG: 50S ribosomal protein L3 [Bradymonadales bacterium]|nr:50S ribosomal protein L3 [Bradymonadales bacterium]